MLRVRPADTLIYVAFNDGNGDFPQALGKLYALGCGSSRWEFDGGVGVGNFVGDSREEFFSISDFSNPSGALFCAFRLRDTPDNVDNWFEFIGSTRVESNFSYSSSGITVDEIVDFDRDGYSDIFYDSSEGTNQAISYRQLKPKAGNTLQFEPSIKWGKGELNRFPVLQDAIVGAVVLLSNQNVSYTARTNQYGEFIFNDIEPGEYTMRALFPGYQVQARSVSIPSAQNSVIGLAVEVEPPTPTATATPSTTASATPTATPPVAATATPTPVVSVTPTPRATATGSASPAGNTPGITGPAELSIAFTSRPSLRSKRSIRSKLTVTNQGPTSCDRVQVTTQITNRAGVAPAVSPRAVVVLSSLPAKKKKSTVMAVSLLKKYSLKQFNYVLATAQCLQPQTNSAGSVVTRTAKIIL
jgi:hypothetical protein